VWIKLYSTQDAALARHVEKLFTNRVSDSVLSGFFSGTKHRLAVRRFWGERSHDSSSGCFSKKQRRIMTGKHKCCKTTCALSSNFNTSKEQEPYDEAHDTSKA